MWDCLQRERRAAEERQGGRGVATETGRAPGGPTERNCALESYCTALHSMLSVSVACMHNIDFQPCNLSRSEDEI